MAATCTTTTIDLANLPPVIDMYPDAARVLGIGRTTAYELTRRGQFPVPVLKVGGRYRVVSAHLRELLGVPA
ncbi:helix-turn-helix transcriptional regulator [Blastococcus sp. SYSU DS1021]